MNFLKNVLATLVGLFIFCFLFFFFIISLGSVMAASSTSKSSGAKKNSIIKLDLLKVMEDYGGSTFIKDIEYRETNSDGLVDVLMALLKQMDITKFGIDG